MKPDFENLSGPDPDDRRWKNRRVTQLIDLLHHQGIPRGVILDAIRYVSREHFVSREQGPSAWENRPLDIGMGQTISQPYTVAYMLNLADVQPSDRVLEVGSGSGYVLALMAYIVGQPNLITGIELDKELWRTACARLENLGLGDIHLEQGDGKHGAPHRAPFDVIVVSAQTTQVPPALIDQLSVGGRLVIPVDVGSFAAMTCIHMSDGGPVESRHGAFQFVPLR